MKKYAAIFPGQGSQSVGMFSDFMDNEIVKQTYDEASEELGYDLKNITLNGPESELNRTEVTQPAILTASVAAYRVLVSMADAPAFVAGHSLGEYTALVAANVMDFKNAVSLVKLRGQAMQNAVPQGVGGMAAVLGLDNQTVIDGCAASSDDSGKVWAANFNSDGQVVISGHKVAVDRAAEYFKAHGAKRVLPLNVSAPSHCPLMQSAADTLQEALDGISLNNASIPVYSNAYAKPLTEATAIKEALIKQLIGPVRWVETVLSMKEQGIELMVEVGPNKVLSGLVRRIDRGLGTANVMNEEGVKSVVEALNA